MATSDVTTRADPLSPGCRGLANPRPESFHSRAPAARKVVLSLGTWNVRTLVDTDGNLNTASKAKKSRKVCSNIREESRRRQDIARHRCTSRRSIAIITRGNAPSRQSSGSGAASRRQR